MISQSKVAKSTDIVAQIITMMTTRRIWREGDKGSSRVVPREPEEVKFISNILISIIDQMTESGDVPIDDRDNSKTGARIIKIDLSQYKSLSDIANHILNEISKPLGDPS
jgi:hypothetical protein